MAALIAMQEKSDKQSTDLVESKKQSESLQQELVRLQQMVKNASPVLHLPTSSLASYLNMDTYIYYLILLIRLPLLHKCVFHFFLQSYEIGQNIYLIVVIHNFMFKK